MARSRAVVSRAWTWLLGSATVNPCGGYQTPRDLNRAASSVTAAAESDGRGGSRETRWGAAWHGVDARLDSARFPGLPRTLIRLPEASGGVMIVGGPVVTLRIVRGGADHVLTLTRRACNGRRRMTGHSVGVRGRGDVSDGSAGTRSRVLGCDILLLWHRLLRRSDVADGSAGNEDPCIGVPCYLAVAPVASTR